MIFYIEKARFDKKKNKLMGKEVGELDENGQRTGLWEWHSDNINLHSKAYYKNNLLDGLYESYYDNRLLQTGYYIDGKTKGLWKTYSHSETSPDKCFYL